MNARLENYGYIKLFNSGLVVINSGTCTVCTHSNKMYATASLLKKHSSLLLKKLNKNLVDSMNDTERGTLVWDEDFPLLHLFPSPNLLIFKWSRTDSARTSKQNKKLRLITRLAPKTNSAANYAFLDGALVTNEANRRTDCHFNEAQNMMSRFRPGLLEFSEAEQALTAVTSRTFLFVCLV